MNTAELLNEIRKTYGREIFTGRELIDILQNCDFSMAEARQIVRESIKARQLGKVSLRKKRRNIPSGKSLVAILTSCK